MSVTRVIPVRCFRDSGSTLSRGFSASRHDERSKRCAPVSSDRRTDARIKLVTRNQAGKFLGRVIFLVSIDSRHAPTHPDCAKARRRYALATSWPDFDLDLSRGRRGSRRTH
jgi:hypothetical protein